MIRRLLVLFAVGMLISCAPPHVRADDRGAAPAPSAASTGQIRSWIVDLGSDRFETRESATRNLERSGLVAVAPLGEAAEGATLEVAGRAIRALQCIAGQDERPSFEVAEVVLERLADSKNRSVSRRASVALDELSTLRRKYALIRIAEFGGLVKALDERGSRDDPPVQVSVAIDRRWKGGNEGLVLVRRWHDSDGSPAHHLYVIAGAPLSPDAIGDLKRDCPLLLIESRGPAMLGIRFRENFEQICAIDRVEKGSPAQKAGLQAGDIILKYDGERLTEFRRLIAITASHVPGDAVELEVLRDGRLLKLEAVLEEWRTSASDSVPENELPKRAPR